jgi:hypothetical protein
MKHDDIGRRRIEHLIRYLALDPRPEPPATTDSGSSKQEWSDIVAAGLTTRLLGALAHGFRHYRSSGAAQHLEQHYGAQLRSMDLRNRSQRRRLVEVIRALNAAGVEPLLASGAREILLESPPWRCVERMLIIVDRSALPAAEVILEGLGWQTVRSLAPVRIGIEQCWVHPETPGVLVMRGAGTSSAAGRLLPWEVFDSDKRATTTDGTSAQLLSPELHCLHAIIDDHCACARRWTGSVELKPLYEFATQICEFDLQQAGRLTTLLDGRPGLHQLFHAWLMVADRTFGLPSNIPFDRPAPVAGPPRLVDVSGVYRVALDLVRGG